MLYVFLVILSAIFGNTFYTFSVDAEILAYADSFTIIPFVMNNYVWVMLFIGFTVGVSMYAKVRGSPYG